MKESIKHRALAICDRVMDTASLFYKVTWSQVEEGDVVLVSEHDFIGEARVVEIRKHDFEGKPCIKANLNPSNSQRRYTSAFWPASAVYVQSRF